MKSTMGDDLPLTVTSIQRLLRTQYAASDLDVISLGPRRPAPSR